MDDEELRGRRELPGDHEAPHADVAGLERGEVRLEREVDARGAADARTGHVGDSEIAQELGDSDVRGLNRECDER